MLGAAQPAMRAGTDFAVARRGLAADVLGADLAEAGVVGEDLLHAPVEEWQRRGEVVPQVETRRVGPDIEVQVAGVGMLAGVELKAEGAASYLRVERVVVPAADVRRNLRQLPPHPALPDLDLRQHQVVGDVGEEELRLVLAKGRAVALVGRLVEVADAEALTLDGEACSRGSTEPEGSGREP